MNRIFVDMPSEEVERFAWMERKLMSLDLPKLVVGLKALGDHREDDLRLLSICSEDQMRLVLQSGLRELTTEQVQTLLKHPDTLFEMQERILTEGGVYWDRVELTPEEQQELREAVDNGWQRIQATRNSANDHLPPAEPEIAADTKVERAQKDGGWAKIVWSVVAIAASIAIGFAIWPQQEGLDGGGWGFDKSGLLAADVSDEEYLRALAAAAGSFSAKMPQSEAELERRLEQFIAGCKQLIRAPNGQLEPDERRWLVEKCAAWLAELQDRLVDLRGGRRWQDVLSDVDAISDRMQSVLQQKAEQLG